MKLVILAGGFGTRLSEETKKKPKPLIKIGNFPIIWHLMKIYSFYGIKQFIICQGYKGHMIKKQLKKFIKRENWTVNFVDTGLRTMTGGRILKIKKFIKDDENFCLSYGDGLSNINIKKLIKFHKNKNKIATVTAVRHQSRFGVLSINKNNIVKKIKEKPTDYINGGFFVLSKKIFKFINSSMNIFEQDCLPKLVSLNQLVSFKHNNFWACMDTVRDKKILNKEWASKNCKWRIW